MKNHDMIENDGLFLNLQVKVWLGDNADHYYVFSRFLLSRMLTVTKVIILLSHRFFPLRI